MQHSQVSDIIKQHSIKCYLQDTTEIPSPPDESLSSASDTASSDTELSVSNYNPTLDHPQTASSSSTDSDEEYCSKSTPKTLTKSELIFKVIWFIFTWQAAFHISGAAIRCITAFFEIFY